MDIVTLKTKEQLDIFINPQRQKLLKILEKSTAPRTPKDLSLELGISPSSVQHHLKKLESIGIVRVDHTASVRGIAAKYYTATRVTVHIGAERDDSLSGNRAALLKMLVANVLDDTVHDFLSHASAERSGDVLTGVIHLPAGRKAELEDIIRRFLEKYAAPCECSEPWEYALVYHYTENQK